MNNNLGIFSTMICMGLTWLVGAQFGATGAIIGGIFFFVVLLNFVGAYNKVKIEKLQEEAKKASTK